MRTSQRDRRRLLVLVVLIFFLFSLSLVEFYKIQISEHALWKERANRQHFFVVKEPFLRGAFWSNSLKKAHPTSEVRFVFDVQQFHLAADPFSIDPEYVEEIASKLTELLSLTAKDKERFHHLLSQLSRNRTLHRSIPEKVQEKIIDWWVPFARSKRIPLKALFFVSDYKRCYPYGSLLGQVLQSVQHMRDEVTGQAKPTGGLELFFDPYLKGKMGKRRLMRSPKHSFDWGEVINAPENGADIYLTIDLGLQAIVEQELERGVKKAGGKGGWAIMMDPFTGEILAMASYPFFSPTEYQNYFNDSEKTDAIRIRGVTDAFEPGSIMKPITLSIALLANEERKMAGKAPIFDIEEKINTMDGRFPGRVQLIKDPSPHRFLNMSMALQKSSNIYVARIIQRVLEEFDNRWYLDKLQNVFGFGEKVHIELPGETAGVVPQPGKLHPNGRSEWSLPTPWSLAMGYNIQASSLQILRAWAILANGGYWVQPALLKKIIKSNGNSVQVLVDKREGGSQQKRVLSESIVKTILKGLKYTTMAGGSCHLADIPGYTEAGKSGTSRKLDEKGVYTTKRHFASFVGFAPINSPKFVLLVTVDEPKVAYIPGVGLNHHGGVAAAPIFREIGKKSLEYLGTPQDDPYGFPIGDPRYDPVLAHWVKETRELQEIYQKWNK